MDDPPDDRLSLPDGARGALHALRHADRVEPHAGPHELLPLPGGRRGMVIEEVGLMDVRVNAN